MSKQSQAKEAQQYVPKVIPQTCGVCRNCEPVMGEVMRYKDPTYTSDGTHMATEKVSQKCSIGGFAVKKMGSCSMWLPLLPNNAGEMK